MAVRQLQSVHRHERQNLAADSLNAGRPARQPNEPALALDPLDPPPGAPRRHYHRDAAGQGPTALAVVGRAGDSGGQLGAPNRPQNISRASIRSSGLRP